jgi:GT2 family glycosyltransferase
LQPDVLTLLTKAFDDVPGTGIAHPEITDIKDPTVGMHYNGAQIHYLCASIARAVTPSADLRSQYEVFDSVSGAVLLVDRALALELGGFDEDFFFNWEDGDFTIRFTLAGYKVVNVPAASALHHGKERGTTMVFYQVRNRWFFVLKYYSARTLFLVFPMFVIYEASQVIFLTLQGALGEYFRAVTAVIRSFPELRKKRQAFRCRKIKADNEWLHSGEVYVPPALLKSRMQVRLKNLYFGFFNLYWAIVRRFCW